MNLDHSNISDEDLVEVIKLSIEFSDEYHEWYLDLYVSIYFTNNKRYFKNYRQINNYIASTIISDLFLIKKNWNNPIRNVYSRKMKIRF
jgi:hypothetical protein